MSQLAVTKSIHDNIPICDFQVWKNIEFFWFLKLKIFCLHRYFREQVFSFSIENLRFRDRFLFVLRSVMNSVFGIDVLFGNDHSRSFNFISF